MALNTKSPTSNSQKRKILLTAALPYANGSLHIGHMLEHIYADFWTRFQNMRGHQCLFICGDDTHGTPIMVEARKRNITPEQLIAKALEEHKKDLKEFQIEHTFYSSTNTESNKKLSEFFFQKMKEKGHIKHKTINQLYCEHDKMFLPDRFVKGTCPKCKSKDQYGDACDVCSATYSPSEMSDTYCSVCKNKPVEKPSEQILFQLDHFRNFLQDWLPKHLSKEMTNKMQEWFKEPLRDWDISRNAPYFGFLIPGYTDKYFYVWVDAPMGYISITKDYCEKNGLEFSDFWSDNRNEITSEVYHLIGKDITYFHTLFWPALLNCADFRTPNEVWVHGMILINGEKMSKSKGTFLSARVYLNNLDPMYLRYYFASKFSNTVDDVDINYDDFTNRVNAELIGKITNLASRGAQMLNNKLDGKMSELDQKGKLLLEQVIQKGDEIAQFYENREFVKVITEVRTLAEEANKYFDEKAPWKTLESNPSETKKVLTSTLNIFRALAIYLKPVLPEYAKKVEKLFNETPYVWESSKAILTNHKINVFEPLAVRIDPAQVKNMQEENKKELLERAKLDGASSDSAKSAASTSSNSGDSVITIDDFTKVDLRIAEIIEAEEIKEADKLLRLKVNLGPLGQRQIIAGIKSAYQADQLKGRHVLVVANLAPRKMKFGISEGMVLAAGAGGKELFVLSPDSGAKPGDKVK